MSELQLKKAKITDFVPDDKNANEGTVRGTAMLENSLRDTGTGRSILVDKNNKVIGGNKTLQSAVDIGLEDAIIVPSDGKSLIVVQRTDIDLDSPEGRKMALYDNRTAQVNLSWDYDILDSLMNEDNIDLSPYFDSDELMIDTLDRESTEDIDIPDDLGLQNPRPPESRTNAYANDSKRDTDSGDDGNDNGRDKPISVPTQSSMIDRGGEEKIPLAIVLSVSNARRWQQWKEKIKARNDSAAFLQLLEIGESE